MAKKDDKECTSAQLDQFYTNKKVAKTIIDGVIKKIPRNNRKVFLEPSAGNGAFLDILLEMSQKCIAFDLDPKRANIIKKDFLITTIEDFNGFTQDSICTIGNPPFGNHTFLLQK